MVFAFGFIPFCFLLSLAGVHDRRFPLLASFEGGVLIYNEHRGCISSHIMVKGVDCSKMDSIHCLVIGFFGVHDVKDDG